MAIRLGRVIYWLTCGLAAIAAAIGVALAVSEWPRRPPTLEAVDLADIAVEGNRASANRYVFKFADGSKYLVDGPAGERDYSGARQKLRENIGTELTNFRDRRQAALLPLGACAAIAIGLYLFGRAVRYVLANE